MEAELLYKIDRFKSDFNIVDLLSDLPHDTERRYELFINKIIQLETVTENNLSKILKDSSADIKIRYAAFFAMCTIYRRNKDYTLYGNLLREYQEAFKDFKSILHLKSMYFVEFADTEDEIREVIDLCKQAIKYGNDNEGFLHSFSITVAKAFEDGFLRIENPVDLKLLDEALIRVDKAIEKDEYAKFYATKGRLKLIKGEYDEAKKDLNKAIDIEDSTREDYSYKLIDYQGYLANVTLKKNISKIDDIEKKLAEATKELENAKTNNLEFLGFFTALISFTIGSIQVLNNQSFIDAIRLILVLCGGLLLVLGGFGIILNGNKNIKRNIVVWILGASLIIFAIFSISPNLLFIQ